MKKRPGRCAGLAAKIKEDYGWKKRSMLHM